MNLLNKRRLKMCHYDSGNLIYFFNCFINILFNYFQVIYIFKSLMFVSKRSLYLDYFHLLDNDMNKSRYEEVHLKFRIK